MGTCGSLGDWRFHMTTEIRVYFRAPCSLAQVPDCFAVQRPALQGKAAFRRVWHIALKAALAYK